ncbi:hypothetical protein FEM48_Zijuj03G0117800 [Ziziphus jujuba var. spinosa]|uniref:Uncharacterized protein n=1 Tax=Ziziphus jujuba var. spinosa TaxID=714518 RepID=A0A978VQ48_ZIZJJ|nr:hypothetical protein FEM48_Zijuj03G0117800 [Ziziphus jujuba var. spinosa]
MENRCHSENVSDQFLSMQRSDSKLIGEKRESCEFGQENNPGPRKRVKMRDLVSVCSSEGIDARNTKPFKNVEVIDEYQFDDGNMSQVTEVPITMDLDASLTEKTGKDTFPGLVKPVPRSLDLNMEMCSAKDEDHDDSKECSENSDKLSLLGEHEMERNTNCATSRGIGVDLNAEDVSSSLNKDPFFPYKNSKYLKPRDVSECGSSTGPLEENDSFRLWKEMKQNGFLSHNGFLSSSHGGIPMPKQRGRKSKKDVLKKNMELAKREQVDRFTKIAAPSGLLNELNPGIINHVRNRKQVHSIIEALVKSEKLESDHGGKKETTHLKIAKEIGKLRDLENKNDSGMQGLSFLHEDRPPNIFSGGRLTKVHSMSINKYSQILEGKDGESDRTSVERLSGKSGASQSTLVSGDDTLALKLSSSTKDDDNESPLSHEDSASYLSVKAATIASQWLDLLHQDIKGRLSGRALFLNYYQPCRDRSSSYENNPYGMKNSADGFCNSAPAEMHRARWSTLFDQMDKALSDEEKQLESWLNQVKEMQLHCDQGLHHIHWITASGSQQLGTSDSDMRSWKADSSDRELAIRAAAASIYSTCNFLLTENISCF